MPSPEDQERAVFDNDDDDDDTDGDDSDLDDEDDYTDEGPPPPPQPSTAAAAAAGDQYLNSSTPSTSSSDRTPNANPNGPNPSPAVAVPQNGAIQVLPLSTAAPTAGDLQIQVTPAPEERRALANMADDSRRLFQRLWTDDDEMKILQGFLEFTSQRGTTFASHQYDTGPFYEQIRKQIQIEFSKNQLIEKLRRLKKKFRNAASKISSGKEFVFKSPHDQATFEISRKIWSVNLKRSQDSDDDDLATPSNNIDTNNTNTGNEGAQTSGRRVSRSRRRIRRRIEEAAVEVPVVGVTVEDSTAAIRAIPPSAPTSSIIEETVKSCLEPLFKELLKSAIGAPCGLGLNVGGLPLNALLPLNFGENLVKLPGSGAAVDEKWKKQQIMELEVYSKRIELLQDQIKSTLEQLKSPET